MKEKIMLKNLCPKCQTVEGIEPRILKQQMVMNSLSRKDNSTYICGLCGNAEALMDYIHNGLTFAMARLAVEDQWQQLIRLPDVDKDILEAIAGFFPTLTTVLKEKDNDD